MTDTDDIQEMFKDADRKGRDDGQITMQEVADEGMHIIQEAQPGAVYESLPGDTPENKLWLFFNQWEWGGEDIASALVPKRYGLLYAMIKSCTGKRGENYEKLPGNNPEQKMWLFFKHTGWTHKDIGRALGIPRQTITFRMPILANPHK